ncbi:hypothetical protein Zmor_000175 [Zophobas morio]|uniref:Helicase MOV-10 Ig-like domain-containing protein n=1 Tax=Zophobas morio TaxID=2755281 RepID=A0AA38IW47_9CUCU|nr:hypothetical protein Zmor_000175 [Zophobas morio]
MIRKQRQETVAFEYNAPKALVNDRHGVELKIEVKKVNNFHYDFRNIKGKYVIKVTPEQLRLHNYTITFKCKIKNTKKDPFLVTNTNLLHPSHYFDIIHDNCFGDDESTFIKIAPGHVYPFKVTFTTDVLSCASYKIPLSCDFQTSDNKDNFTIVRTFLTIIADNIAAEEEKTKSPFTSQPWKDVHTTPTRKSTQYTDKYQVPGKLKRLVNHRLQRFTSCVPVQNNFYDVFF